MEEYIYNRIYTWRKYIHKKINIWKDTHRQIYTQRGYINIENIYTEKTQTQSRHIHKENKLKKSINGYIHIIVSSKSSQN